jgi:uncharacterized protein (DUF1697 family)
MPVYVALLRAVNVGGTGSLKMDRLRKLCAQQGLENATTYIQSGNVVFNCELAERDVKATLERALTRALGKSAGVLVREASELAASLKRNPFPDAPPQQVLVFFLDEAPPRTALSGLVIPGREKVELRGRELFVHFPEGQGRSKLKIPFAKTGTGRNLNTVRKLVAMAGALEP